MSAQAAVKQAHRATWVAWFTWTLSVAIIIAAQIFGYLNDPSNPFSGILFALVLLAFATVGALIVSRRPENPIGWLLVVGTLLLLLGGFALEYAVYTLKTAPHSLPGGEWMLWLGGWLRGLGFFTLILFVPLLFPNGQLPSPHWRRIAQIAIGALALNTFATMFDPVNESELRLPPLPNPLGIALPSDIQGPLNGISFLGLGVMTLLVAASVVIRFRRARGEERQQLKWFAYAGVVAALVFIFILIGIFLLPESVMAKSGGYLFSLLLAGFPIALGIAILKYRLYEIDLLINRTLVYVPLTAILAGIFSASITLTQKFFVAITGQTSDAATVLTTLIVVAAFEPLKSGLQNLVDRRFKTPTQKFGALSQQVQSVLQVIDPQQLAGRLLQDAVATYDARGGAVFLQCDGHLQLAASRGEWNGNAELIVALESEAARVGLIQLAKRRSGAGYSDQDRTSLEEISTLVARAISLAGHHDGGA